MRMLLRSDEVARPSRPRPAAAGRQRSTIPDWRRRMMRKLVFVKGTCLWLFLCQKGPFLPGKRIVENCNAECSNPDDVEGSDTPCKPLRHRISIPV